MKLLLIDDEDAVRPRMANALSEIEGLEVSCCSPRAEVILQEMLMARPDVVVMDIRMDGGALDLVRSIKLKNHPPVVIALSSPSTLPYRTACHGAGAEYFFDKVREQAKLLEAVAGLQEELGR